MIENALQQRVADFCSAVLNTQDELSGDFSGAASLGPMTEYTLTTADIAYPNNNDSNWKS